MITTSNGSYEAKTSPSLMRPNTWGMAGVGVNQSRSGRSLVIDELPRADVQLSELSSAPAGPVPTSNPGPGILWNNAGTPEIGT